VEPWSKRRACRQSGKFFAAFASFLPTRFGDRAAALGQGSFLPDDENG
jgi:hypothetical protein